MKRAWFCFALPGVLLLAGVVPARAQTKRPITAQAERGRELFLKSPKGVACGTCHTMAGAGTAVGPDLAPVAAIATPRGLVAMIQTTMTENVQEIKTASGTFPGIQKQKNETEVEIWDLGQTPPALRKMAPKDILSSVRDQKWKHPPTSAGYTSSELADIIGFLKWAANGSTREIKAAEIEGNQ